MGVAVQFACEGKGIPTEEELSSWVSAVLADERVEDVDPFAEITLRIVDAAEGARLNERYRHRAGATNVLSFPHEWAKDAPLHTLGDIVICAPVVRREAAEQTKDLNAHWAHMVVHGTLHLLGYTHEQYDQAREMESVETEILSRLNIPDPYVDPGSA